MAYSKSEKKTHAGPNKSPRQIETANKKRKADYIAKQKRAKEDAADRGSFISKALRLVERGKKKTAPLTPAQRKKVKGRQASEKNPVYMRNLKNKK